MVFLKIIGNKYGTETQYLLSTKANSKRLSESIQQAEKGELRSFTVEELETV